MPSADCYVDELVDYFVLARAEQNMQVGNLVKSKPTKRVINILLCVYKGTNINIK